VIPYPFTYNRAKSVAEAERLLDGEAQLLAGGQSLIPAMKTRLAAPSALVDISGLKELAFIRVESDSLVIGANATHFQVAGSAEAKRVLPALAQLAGMIGDPAVRYRGTLGGSLANNDPAADYPAAALALAATIKTNRRQIAADDFFTGLFATALEPGEIILEARFTLPQRAAYAKFRNPASRYALAGVFVAQARTGVRVAATGAGACVFRLEQMERALEKNFSPAALAGITVDAGALNSDIHASAEYRAHLVGVMARRAVESALA
jgi:aerobic carbon-monoxide dehydrogenase medium subunit